MSSPTNCWATSVSMTAGATALTRTPRCAYSIASALVNPTTACLLATYVEVPCRVRRDPLRMPY